MLTLENTVVSPNNNSENIISLADLNKAPIGLFAEIQNISRQQLSHALASPDDSKWEMFVNDDDMKLYKMENEINGIPVDPLKAVLFVKVKFYHFSKINNYKLNTKISKFVYWRFYQLIFFHLFKFLIKK